MLSYLRRVRQVGKAEGISFLILLFVAMPFKYFLGIPQLVTIVGWAHGALFMAFVAMAVAAVKILRWSWIDLLLALGASVVPFGTFVLDRSWREQEQRLAKTV